MILSDLTIQKMLKSETLVIEPKARNFLQGASVDCRLGDHYLLVEPQNMKILTMDKEIPYRAIIGENYTIPPHSFVLASTMEYVELPLNVTAFVEGRSSIGRMGLFIQNAGWVAPGFKGRITLELYNANSLPIKLTRGRRICQLVFCSLDQPTQKPYRGKYQGQKQSVGSRIYQDPEARRKKSS